MFPKTAAALYILSFLFLSILFIYFFNKEPSEFPRCSGGGPAPRAPPWGGLLQGPKLAPPVPRALLVQGSSLLET